MPKWITKFLQLRVDALVRYVLFIAAFLSLFNSHGKFNYDHIPKADIPKELLLEVNPNLKNIKAKPACQYIELLKNTKSLEPWQIPTEYNDFSAAGITNGSFVPEECMPQLSVAILIPYRNRQSQLDKLLPYLHNFLRKQKIHYKIYVIEQQDEKVFNKGLLFNIGARQAILDKFPCFILHDVDLFPLDESNLYACLKQPRHMSASIDKFRYVLPYDYLVGGVLAMPSNLFIKVNGFSNSFLGWGGEDDDMAMRMEAQKLILTRFPREMSRYSMIFHPQEKKNQERSHLLHDTHKRMDHDGYNSIKYSSVHVNNNRLFTLIGVKVL